MKRLFGLIRSKTPKVGRKLAGVGVTFAGIGASLEFAEPTIAELLPADKRHWYLIYLIAMRILEIVGVLTFGAGVASTTSNPDEIIKDE